MGALLRGVVFLSLLACSFGWRSNWTLAWDLHIEGPNSETLYEIPINSSTFSSVTFSALLDVTVPTANFTLILSLSSEKGDEYFFPAFEYEGTGESLVYVTSTLDPCVVSGYESAYYSLQAILFTNNKQVHVQFFPIVSVDIHILTSNASTFQTVMPNEYFEFTVSKEHNKNDVTIAIEASQNQSVPFSHLCVNDQTCPASSIDCFSSSNIATKSSTWNTTLKSLSPGTYYILLAPVKENITYSIYTSVHHDEDRNLMLPWYYVLLIAVGCIVVSGAVVSCLCWRKTNRSGYIQVPE